MTRWPSLISFHSLERIRTIFLSRSNYNFVTDKSSDLLQRSLMPFLLAKIESCNTHTFSISLHCASTLVALSNLIFKVPRIFAIDVLSGEYKIHVD